MPASPDDLSAFVDFCGEVYPVPHSVPLRIGREGDLEINDNPFLHRRFLELSFHNGLLWLSNVGSSTSVTVSDGEGLAQSWVSPGASIPLVFPKAAIWFTAGPTTYELEVCLSNAPFLPVASPEHADGETTTGSVTFTPDQRLLLIALAEDVLRRGDRRSGAVPQSAVAAARLGWTTTKFNRKLDNVCEKLSRLGVKGLVSEGGRAASGRRARLVEYILASRTITAADLEWLESLPEHSTPTLG